MGEEMRILSIHPCGTSRVLLHAVKSYDMGPSGLTSQKNPSPWPGSNTQPLSPVASTLTTTPPRRLAVAVHTTRQQFQCIGVLTLICTQGYINK
jgi:hypothetical protein